VTARTRSHHSAMMEPSSSAPEGSGSRTPVRHLRRLRMSAIRYVSLERTVLQRTEIKVRRAQLGGPVMKGLNNLTNK
jgi:hypothetical protein